ncbi:TBC-domain-containing protein [Ascodesmis nigricans]|uniref:TBC-domain-containing protein n=1 Tax=Ascodesmis nigricans TaxID=341454 RepID=A0A4S2MZF0_9PEZI|nr:TBC-domain-containing protein [Ascodesmis nigricans]
MASAASSSSTAPGMRRIKKFPSSSVLPNNTTTDTPSPALSTNVSNTSSVARLSATSSRNNPGALLDPTQNQPILRSQSSRIRSQSQSQLDVPSTVTRAHSAKYHRKGISTAGLSTIRPITIETLLSRPPTSLPEGLKTLKNLVLTQGVPADNEGNSAVRVYIWSILLGVTPMKTKDYVTLVRRGASSSYSKIRNDTFRTLATDPLFRRKVSEASLIRLLNAFQWKMRDKGLEAQYVQGMNVIAAPFLYAAKSEVEAFSLFAAFIERECPAYVRPTMEGVHRGLKLVDQCLEIVDPKLFEHLQSKFLTAELYAFPSVLTLCACTPPLPEVLKLWDFLIAYGAHLNILCVVAQLLLMRDELLAAQSPMKLLRQFPPLESKSIINVAVSLVRRIPDNVFDALVVHARDA